MKLVITRGLPASGKTTWARAWLAEPSGGGRARVRVNRDDIRTDMFGAEGVLAWADEELITTVQQTAVRAALAAGRDVVVDDTNLRAKYARAWADLARSMAADFEVRDFVDVPLEELLARDAARGAAGERFVGADVIRDLHARFLAAGRLPQIVATPLRAPATPVTYQPDEALPPAWLVDVDGTLALMDGRGPFEWHRVGEDRPNPAVVELAGRLAEGAALVVMSGRDAVCRVETLAWLERHRIPFAELHMRAAGDQRKDSIVKSELFWAQVAPRWNVRGVLDDRQQVVDMWRSLGLMCAQVAPGDF
jgi:predicted kinase